MVLYKSMNLVPVLIGDVLLYGKRKDVNEVVSAIILTVGVVGFTLADPEVPSTFTTYGVLAMMLVICADIGIGNVQRRTLEQSRYSNSDIMFYSNSIGFLVLLVALVLSQTFEPAFTFCNKHAMETYGYTALSSLFGFLGTNVVQTMVRAHGSLIGMTDT
ncbi:adenosine 3'-phospho 5'-phosphosulfate transporter 2-like [Pecten maximus]|uniref:adenosine 3'-phospho 5'-phosphosulfate transporter 2-like n=1 Tax=Pecten maximus TaxID=6579 RepID=UPI001458F54D|nr:adenosine 3'-phospho 5'-phosphosulfate transporter 2-like [Pecten maximus]